eukprot:5687333-Pyramimonas_sp.AAC.1
MGWHGVWAPALPAEAGGSSSGVAVLVPRQISITTAVYAPDDGILIPGRLIAAHVRWGVVGGL